jgi:predicted dehydrogenase
MFTFENSLLIEKPMNNRNFHTLSRRAFLKRSAQTAAGLTVVTRLSRGAQVSPNEKLNIGMVGVANQANYDLTNVASENIVALCDIDDDFLAKASEKFPKAKKYNDFRRLLEQKDIDAVVIAIPDHTHAVAAVAALKSGRHVYCEKPLARTVAEARAVTDTARAQKRVTQIGTQIHAGNNYRRVVELVQSGAIGKIAEVHVWVAASYGGKDRPKETPPVPPNVHYDLWLGPVDFTPYHPDFLPFKWRNWWAFGGGALADFGCHYMDLPHWALNLRHASTIEPVDGPPVNQDSPPPWLIVKYQYEARGELPPVTLTWYHGGKRPSLLTPEQSEKWKSGVLFIGEKGSLIADYNRHALLPEKEFEGFHAPPHSIPNSIGHHKEWIQACKTGTLTTCNFDYSGPLSETALLGNVAFRVGKKLNWDHQKLKATNCPEADQYIQYHYRAGWTI